MAAAASDKARFYLEQQVPELQYYKERGIFTPEEITAITSKRSSFEHRINMAGASSPVDYARYASYEQTLDALRRKRCLRKGVKGTHFAGQKRVFSILERGTWKFPGDMGLWMQYLEFCKNESANAKLNQGLTKVLRLHPVKWELWVWAARHYFEAQGDITAARSFMQRGLRFCERERDMWLQYMKLEMVYVAKVAARRKILKLDEEVEEMVEGAMDMDADEVALPVITMQDMQPAQKDKTLSLDDATLKRLAKSPALSGAIPMAIVDAAFKTFKGDLTILEDLFDLVAGFFEVPCTPTILQHIRSLVPDEPSAALTASILDAKLQLAGVDPSSAAFPSALGQAIIRLKSSPAATVEQEVFKHQRMVSMLLPLAAKDEDLDEDIAKVLNTTCQHHIKALQKVVDTKTFRGPNPVNALAKSLVRQGIKVKVLAQFGLVGKPEE